MSEFSRRKIAETIATELTMGTPPAEAMQRLAGYLVEHHQLDKADEYVRDIEAALEARGHVIADVTTARELPESLLAKIRQVIGGAHVTLRTHVDPSVLGGIRIETPTARLDATTRQKLRQLRAS